MSWSLLLPLALAQSWSEIAPGVQYAQWTTVEPNRISALQIDLCKSGVRVRATASADRGQTTSAWGSSQGLVAAVNGGFFTSGYAPDQGRAAGYGAEWADSTDTIYRGFIGFGEHQLDHAPSGYTESLPSWMEEAVNGDATLVYDGAVIDCGGCGSGAAPRTAAGYTQDGHTLLLVTVDGRSSSSAGMTIDELAVLMGELGAWRAMNLDGGGSTTMWTAAGGVVNDPSDGAERTVANHLGVSAPGTGLQHNCPDGYRADWAGVEFAGAHGATITAPAGSVVSGSVTLQNNGTYSWDTHATRLAPLPRDTAHPAAAGDWIATHRIAAVEAPTDPGQSGTFRFSLTMPADEGEVTTLELTVLQELVSWFGDSWGPADGEWVLTLVASAPAVDTGGGADTQVDTGPGDTGPAEVDTDREPGDSGPPEPPERPGDAVLLGELGCAAGAPRGAGGALLALLALARRRQGATSTRSAASSIGSWAGIR